MNYINCTHCQTKVSVYCSACPECDKYPHHDNCGYYIDRDCICDLENKED